MTPPAAPQRPAPARRGMPHEALIVPGSAVSAGGPNEGKRAEVWLPLTYPLRATCLICDGPVRREQMEPGLLDWAHEGPGPAPLNRSQPQAQ